MSGFKKFLLRGNLIDLAVAVVIGVAFNAVVQALVTDIIGPLIAAIVGKPRFSSLAFTINHSRFPYGLLVNALIAFVSIAVVIYFLIVAPMNRITAIAQRKQEATTRSCPECTSEIPIAAKRCMYCTVEVPPVPPVPLARHAR
jgi:large conductance mechanosensitive channel